MKLALGSNKGSLQVIDMRIGDHPFNPTDRAFQQQLKSKLGVDQRSVIECLGGFEGARNEGIFILKSCGEELVLKLVKSQTPFPGVPTEAENFIELSRAHPTLGTDIAVAFPRYIIRLLGSRQECRYDLIVMPKAPGRALANVIIERWRAGRSAEAMDILEKVGVCLSGFHQRYGGKQHCDLTPTNVLFDEASFRVYFIDLGGMGTLTSESDKSYFARCFRSSAQLISAQLATQGIQHFNQGYDRTATGQIQQVASPGSLSSPATSISSVGSPLTGTSWVSVGSQSISPCESKPRRLSACRSAFAFPSVLPTPSGKLAPYGAYAAVRVQHAPYPALLLSPRR